MFIVGIVKLNRNSIAMTENISIVFQLFLSLTVKSQFIKKVDFSEFRKYTSYLMKTNLFFIFFLMGAFLNLSYAQHVPNYNGRVNDNANLLSQSEKKDIELISNQLKVNLSIDFAVLTINNLDGFTVEQYAKTVFNTWQLGTSRNNDGVLLLISKEDREMRLQVGYGLESKLTYSVCKDILDYHVRPEFKSGSFAKGITAAIHCIELVLNGNYSENTSENPSSTSSHKPLNPFWIIGIISGFFSMVIIIVIYKNLSGVSTNRYLHLYYKKNSPVKTISNNNSTSDNTYSNESSYSNNNSSTDNYSSNDNSSITDYISSSYDSSSSSSSDSSSYDSSSGGSSDSGGASSDW
jgi:uncharacterized protein